MSLHPTLQTAKDALLTRRSLRERFSHHPTSKVRHDRLQVAYQPLLEGRFFRILYCPACLRGHVTDVVRQLPEDAVMARELELRQTRPWRLECLSNPVTHGTDN